MKIKLIALAFIMTCHVAMAQKNGWEIGTGLSLGSAIQLKSRDGFKTSDNASISHFSTGVFASKFFKKDFGFEFGAQISHFSIKRYKYERLMDISGNYGNVFFLSQRGYFFGEIPLRFIYKKSFRKIDLGVFAGLTPAALVSVVESNSNNAGSSVENVVSNSGNITRDMYRFNLFSDMGIFFRVNVYRRLYFEARPIVRVSLVPLQNNEATTTNVERMMSAGGYLGVAWKL